MVYVAWKRYRSSYNWTEVVEDIMPTEALRKIGAVGWDVDRVWYPGISTSFCAESSRADPKLYLAEFVEKGWFGKDDVNRWMQSTGNAMATVADLAMCLTDFFYRMKKPGSSEPVITKEQIVAGKQHLLKGMNMREVIDIAEKTPLTQGLFGAVEVFDSASLHQAAFSDGLYPFVVYICRAVGIDYVEGVPCYVCTPDSGQAVNEMLFTPEMVKNDKIVLAGKVGKFDKAWALFEHMKSLGYDPRSLAVIDDSASSINTIFRPIRDAGGIAIGFNPTEEHMPAFKAASIPVLKQEKPDLEPFKDIVMDPRDTVIGKYCV